LLLNSHYLAGAVFAMGDVKVDVIMYTVGTLLALHCTSLLDNIVFSIPW